MASPKLPPITPALNVTLDDSTLVATGTIHAPLPADHSFYAVVGRVAAEWASFEHVLDLIIWDLAATEAGIGAAITAQMLGATNRFRSILALGACRHISKPALEAARTLMERSYNPSEARNRIVHDSWFVQTTSGQLGQFRSMAHKDLRYGLVDIDPGEIEKTLSDIRDLVERARHLRALISNELQASRRKYP